MSIVPAFLPLHTGGTLPNYFRLYTKRQLVTILSHAIFFFWRLGDKHQKLQKQKYKRMFTVRKNLTKGKRNWKEVPDANSRDRCTEDF